MKPEGTLLLKRSDIAALLNVEECMTAVEQSFRLYAEGGELADEYAGSGCASARSPECANLIVDNLDGWAAWYETNA